MPLIGKKEFGSLGSPRRDAPAPSPGPGAEPPGHGGRLRPVRGVRPAGGPARRPGRPARLCRSRPRLAHGCPLPCCQKESASASFKRRSSWIGPNPQMGSPRQPPAPLGQLDAGGPFFVRRNKKGQNGQKSGWQWTNWGQSNIVFFCMCNFAYVHVFVYICIHMHIFIHIHM